MALALLRAPEIFKDNPAVAREVERSHERLGLLQHQDSTFVVSKQQIAPAESAQIPGTRRTSGKPGRQFLRASKPTDRIVVLGGPGKEVAQVPGCLRFDQPKPLTLRRLHSLAEKHLRSSAVVAQCCAGASSERRFSCQSWAAQCVGDALRFFQVGLRACARLFAIGLVVSIGCVTAGKAAGHQRTHEHPIARPLDGKASVKSAQ